MLNVLGLHYWVQPTLSPYLLHKLAKNDKRWIWTPPRWTWWAGPRYGTRRHSCKHPYVLTSLCPVETCRGGESPVEELLRLSNAHLRHKATESERKRRRVCSSLEQLQPSAVTEASRSGSDERLKTDSRGLIWRLSLAGRWSSRLERKSERGGDSVYGLGSERGFSLLGDVIRTVLWQTGSQGCPGRTLSDGRSGLQSDHRQLWFR